MPNQSVSRRSFLSVSGAVVGAAAVGQMSDGAIAAEAEAQAAKVINRDEHGKSFESLRRLLEGNRRYVENRRLDGQGRRGERRRDEVAESQEPFALIFTCADSRVIPEVIFNKGIGDLFVVRVAGNFVTERCFGVLGSIEYAVQFLHCPLVMVLGHERCGAVKAALNLIKKNERPPGNIGIIADEIKPALAEIEKRPGDLLHNAVLANVALNEQRLVEYSTVVREHVESGRTQVVGADYDLDTGLVGLVESLPAPQPS